MDTNNISKHVVQPNMLTDLQNKTVSYQDNIVIISDDFNDASNLPRFLKIIEQIATTHNSYFSVTQKQESKSNKTTLKITKSNREVLKAVDWIIGFMEKPNNNTYIELNPYLEAFYQSTKSLYPHWLDNWFFIHNNAERVTTHLNQAIDEYRQHVASKPFKKRLKAYKRNIKKNGKSFHRYIDTLFTHHAKLLFIRIDVGYGDAIKSDVTDREAKTHRDLLIKRVKQNYPDLVGYVWKLEYTPRKKYHYHLLFVFNGNNVRADILIAINIGKYWQQEITQGYGTYFNCNQRKEDYGERLAIGMIKRTDDDLRGNLSYVIDYLVKTDLYVKANVADGVRTFGKGEIIKRKKRTTKKDSLDTLK